MACLRISGRARERILLRLFSHFRPKVPRKPQFRAATVRILLRIARPREKFLLWVVVVVVVVILIINIYLRARVRRTAIQRTRMRRHRDHLSTLQTSVRRTYCNAISWAFWLLPNPGHRSTSGVFISLTFP